MKNVLLLLTLIFSLTNSFAQNGVIRGTVTDVRDGLSIPGAAVLAINTADTSVRKGAAADIDGAFLIPGLPDGSYRIRISSLSYAAMEQSVEVFGDTNTLNIKMQPEGSTLEGVIVRGEAVKATQSGDTTSFNANAFKTNPDATAEDLITKMPGITTDGGTVKVNGEEVKKVFVDGKEFFGDDPNAALKNLPAEVIDRIQIFDRASDQAQFTGFDDGSSSKSINIVTRRGRAEGTFGRLQAGYGTDERYSAGGNVNVFNGDRRISLVGLANNVNTQNFSSEDLVGISQSSSGGRGSGGGGFSGGGGRGGGGAPSGGRGGQAGGGFGGDASSNFLVNQQGGNTSTLSGGINYSDTWSKAVKVSGSYFYNRTDNTSATALTRNYIVSNADSSLVYNEDVSAQTINTNHRANFRFDWTIDSNNSLLITPRISYQVAETDRSSLGYSVLAKTFEQSRVNTINRSTNNGINASTGILYRRRLTPKGRTLSLNVNGGYNGKTGDGILYSNNRFTGSDTSLNDQQYDLEASGLNLSANLTYTEPVGRKSQLLINYNPSLNRNASDRYTYNRAGSDYTDLDTGLSNVFDNDYIYHRGGASYNFNDSNFSGSVSLNAQYATLTGTQTFPYSLAVDRAFRDILPGAFINYRFSRTENIRIWYRTSTNPPSISQLQNIVDNSNPLLLRTGNADLRQDYNHNVGVRYGRTNTRTNHSLFLFANGSYTAHYIGNATVIAIRDTTAYDVILPAGSQLSIPINLDGAYSARAFLTYGMPLKSLKSNLNLSAGYTYSRTPAIINSGLNYSKNYIPNAGVVVSSNISENVDFTLSYNGSYTTTKNTLQAASDYSYYTQSTSAKLNLIFLKGFVFNTNVQHTLYSGLGEGYDQSFLLWNASLGYKFGRKKEWTADIYVFDILNQNRSIARNITESYVEDSRTEVLQRYGMLRLSWNIRKFKGMDMPKSEADGPPGMRPGPGGDRPRMGGEGR